MIFKAHVWPAQFPHVTTVTRSTSVTGVTVLSKVAQYKRMSQTADVTHHWSYVTIGGDLTLRNIPGAPSSWLPMAPEARWRKYF